MFSYSDRRLSTLYSRELEVIVERERAGYGAWYEMFPRSASRDSGRPGTFRDCSSDCPISPKWVLTCSTCRRSILSAEPTAKGKNNATSRRGRDDPGSPWAIGSEEADTRRFIRSWGRWRIFDHLLMAARQHGIEIALDIAYQCSPDHPYVKEHPEWFRHRPDGSVQYAEIRPKNTKTFILSISRPTTGKLWEELKDVVRIWVDAGRADLSRR